MWPFSSTYPERDLADVAGQTFDYIIVGGGTAGCVLARRLSEDAGVSVLLVERGPVCDSWLSRIPLLSQNHAMPFVPGIAGRYSGPIPDCLGRRFALAGAEGLGGTTLINGMLHTRGPPGGYAAWAQQRGLRGWDWDDVEPYFRKMENALHRPGDASRGHDGPLLNRQPGHLYSFSSYMPKACAALGLPVEEDCNVPSASAQGYFRLDSTIAPDGTRWSANRAYLPRDLVAARQAHLAVCTGVIATRLAIDDRQAATGVYMATAAVPGSPEVLVSARREVILCGGALRTPQLLLLSGIGPAADLAALDIPSVHDLPAVGAHLADHLAVPVMIEMPVRDTTHRLLTVLGFVWNLLLYLLLGRGVLGASTTPATVFVRSNSLDDEMLVTKTPAGREDAGREDAGREDAGRPENVPDVEIMLIPVNTVSRDLAGRSFLSLYTALLQACTQGGRVALASRDPRAHPAIAYPFLSTAADWQVLRKAVRFTMRLADAFIGGSGYPGPAALTVAPGIDAEVLQQLTPDVEWSASGTKEKPPAPANTRTVDLPPLAPAAWRSVTDAQIDAYARRTAQSSLHYACSCRMATSARDGVVDARLRVHGLAGLRIADASVLPVMPSAHTMAAVLMVAERCANFIKEERS